LFSYADYRFLLKNIKLEEHLFEKRTSQKRGQAREERKSKKGQWGLV
jgi:hypothetical protein